MIFKNKRLCIIVIVMCISMINGMDKSTENYEPDLYIDETNKNIFQNYVYDANYSDDEDDEKSQNYPGIEKEQNIPASTKRTINDKNPTNKKTNYVGGGLGTKIIGGAVDLGKKVVTGTKDNMKKIGQTIEASVDSGKTAITKTKNKIGQTIETGVKSTQTFATEKKNKMAKRIITTKDEFNEYIKHKLNDAKEKAKVEYYDSIKTLNNKFNSAKEKAKEKYNEYIKYVDNKLNDAKEKAKDKYNEYIKNVDTKLNDAKEKTKEKAYEVKDMLKEKWEKVPQKAQQVKDMFNEKLSPLFELAKNIGKKQMTVQCDKNDENDVQAITTIKNSINVKKLVLKDCTNYDKFTEYLKTNKKLEELDLTDNKTTFYENWKIIEILESNTTITSLKISLEESVTGTVNIIQGFIWVVAKKNQSRTPKKYLNVTIKTDIDHERINILTKSESIKPNQSISNKESNTVKVTAENGNTVKVTAENGNTVTIISKN